MSTRLRDSIEAILNAHKSHGNYVYPAPELRAANMVGLLVDLHDAYRHHLESPREALSAWIVKEFKDTGMDLRGLVVDIRDVSMSEDKVVESFEKATDEFCSDNPHVHRSGVYVMSSFGADPKTFGESSEKMIEMCAPQIIKSTRRMSSPLAMRQAILFINTRNVDFMYGCLVVVTSPVTTIISAADLGNPKPDGEVPVVTHPIGDQQ